MTGRNSGKYLVGIGIALVLIVAILLVTGYLPMNFGGSLTTDNKIEYTESLVTGIINLDAGSYQYTQFDVPDGIKKPIIRGSFFVKDGSEIHVMILDENGFDSWKGGQLPAEAYYYSGPTIAADLEADVPIGETLYIVFDNTSSLTSAKIVDSEIELAYLT